MTWRSTRRSWPAPTSRTTRRKRRRTRTTTSDRVVRPFALGLGGNQGGPAAVRRHLRRALERLRAELGPLAVAPLFRTAPVSPLTQPPYLNTAAVGTTALPPERILALAKELEAEAGRDFTAPRWSERPLDVDLLVYGDLVYTSIEGHGPDLTLPHPRLRERAFVLVPLVDVAPDLPVPPDGRTVRELLADLERREGRDGVERVAPMGWERGGGEAADRRTAPEGV